MEIENNITSSLELYRYLETQGILKDRIYDILEGLRCNSMPLQITQHLLSLIDWNNIVSDPIRRQFLPFASEYLENHPNLTIDSLEEIRFQVIDGIIHKYPKTILFILSTACPCYCAFCTRSYVVGKSTLTLQKQKIKISLQDRVRKFVDYLSSNKEVIDVVISGGDVITSNLNHLKYLISKLSEIKHIKSVRLATRGLTFSPRKLQIGSAFYSTLLSVKNLLDKQNISFSIQSHFNHVNEINAETERTIKDILDLGISIRNQTVLLRNINANTETMFLLINKLIEIGIQPYYVYQMDMVKYAEHFRTTIQASIEIYNELIGKFPGFLFPRFVVDLPDSGGKKDIWAYEWKDENMGVFAYKSTIIPGQICYYHNPIN